MMTRSFLGMVFLSASLIIAGCQKAPELTLTGPASIELSADGGNTTISFTANRDWQAICSEPWVSVTPASGSASDGPLMLTVRCDANTTYEDRTATITIKMEELSQVVTVRQPANLGIILPTQVFNLVSEAQTIEVEVQANVQYSVSVSADWIEQTGTKGLSSNILTFSIKENTDHDAREGTITFKAQQGEVQDQVVRVIQAQKDVITTKDTYFEIPYGGGEIELKVDANVAFDVTSNADWIRYIQTKALSSSTVCLAIDENPDYEFREGTVEIAQQNGALSITVSVRQAGRIAVTSVELDKTNLKLKKGETEKLAATVKPEDATDKTLTWSSSNPAVASVSEDGLVEAVAAGEAVISAVAHNGKEGTCRVVVEEFLAVDMGLSVKWANMNLGSEEVEGAGSFYAWGETSSKSEYSWATYSLCGGSPETITRYGDVDDTYVLAQEDDAASVVKSDGWRIPTKHEFQELVDNCDLVYSESPKGYFLTSRINGNELFLPAVGYMDGSQLVSSASISRYWTASTGNFDEEAVYYGLYDSRGLTISAVSGDRALGCSIRPVQGEMASVAEAKILMDGTEFDFGEVVVGDTGVIEVTVTNVGDADLSYHVDLPAVVRETDGFSENIWIQGNEHGAALSHSLAPGESDVFTVVYTPQEPGADEYSRFVIYTNAVNGNKRILVKGRAAVPAVGGNTNEGVKYEEWEF